MGLFSNLFRKPRMQVKFDKDMDSFAVKMETSILFVGTKEKCETFVQSYGQLQG